MRRWSTDTGRRLARVAAEEDKRAAFALLTAGEQRGVEASNKICVYCGGCGFGGQHPRVGLSPAPRG